MLDSGLALGIDVGSTTVKVGVVARDTSQLLWSRYARHESRQARMTHDLLLEAQQAFPNLTVAKTSCFITGSGGRSIAAPLGARFVQEVNAVTLAVEALHPEVGSVVELGGQDAKIILFKVNPKTGSKSSSCSMNDKCASGTGATLDKCFLKLALLPDQIAALRFDPTRLHPVAARCGVFAETDVVNLLKSGIPKEEIANSVADAIVQQNLSVLTRGNTLRPSVLLLGGPNRFLSFLQECWRLRIPEAWRERGLEWNRALPLEQLIFVPENAEYYALYGAVRYGLDDPALSDEYRGAAALREVSDGRRIALSSNRVGPSLAANAQELASFRERYSLPEFHDVVLQENQLCRGILGIDGGSTSSKCVLIDDQGRVLKKCYQLSKGNPLQDVKEMLGEVRAWATSRGARLDIIGLGVTGYAGSVLERVLRADAHVVETVAHLTSAVSYFGNRIDVVCDIGGQDIKVLFVQNGEIRDFRLSNQCSAGNGMLLQAMAAQVAVPLASYADSAFRATRSPLFNYGCAVFLDSERVDFQRQDFSREELLAGLALVLPKNVWQYIVQLPRMAELGTRYVLQGGTQYNQAALKAQVDYIRARVPDADVLLHPHPGEAGAIGAAFEALRVVRRRGHSTFIGLDGAIGITYTTKNDAETRCDFCPNHCSRTFIDTQTPDSASTRYIAGFSCEKGTVEDLSAVKRLNAERKRRMRAFPNLVDLEATLAFTNFHAVKSLPTAGELIDDVISKKTLLGRLTPQRIRRPMQRSATSASERRERTIIGIPRVLNIWSTGPFWLHYLRTLGVPERNIIFSDETSESLWKEGGKYGSIDPCFPAKVAQAHLHNLMFTQHQRRNLHAIFFPCLTHIPSFVDGLMDTTCCPVVAGTPKVMRAAFTKENDFFAQRGIEYLDPALTMTEPLMLKRKLFQTFQTLLRVTEDESDFAVEQGWQALREFDRRLQAQGRAILDSVERDDRIAILLLGRPYHADPGINHRVLEEFQALGYPILSMRSIPKDKSYLQRFFADDLQKDWIATPLAISDVWPESYSVNSAEKVWAAKFAARHPNVAVLDLSSFKCGHDAPTYGLIERIISARKTPYSALHDIDANKPAGSIKIRTATYAHTLLLARERLEDLREKRAELHYRIQQKKLQLLERRQRCEPGPTNARELAKLRATVQQLEAERAAKHSAHTLNVNRASPLRLSVIQ